MTFKIISTLFLTCVYLIGHAQGQKLTALDTTTIIYKVYFAANQTQLNLNEEKYRDIPEIAIYKDTLRKVFKYTSGDFIKLNDTVARKKLLVDKGIKDTFIMAFKNGRQISLNEASYYK